MFRDHNYKVTSNFISRFEGVLAQKFEYSVAGNRHVLLSL